jgi:hypothetical protein|tara:strand:- start:11946 stop:12185 length:240 start_codon:yes stop_codon:yes gene_type:complete
MNWFGIVKGKRYKKGNVSRKHNKSKKRREALKICPTPNKKKYQNHGHALRRAREIMEKTGNRTLRVYRCGDHYHITKRD